MTDNTQELDEILHELCKNTQADYGYQKLVPSETAKAKQAILDWHNKQIIAELKEAKRSSDAGWYATYRVAELEKQLKEPSNDKDS